ncbi:MAG: rhodanese-like domain-containing protein [Halobacteria archaeon]|nr:rhodanese-like domain-containing protein [Halobacteria archaeon]
MNLALPLMRRAGAESLPTEQARRLLASGGQLVDIRSPADFGRDAPPGALNLPIEALGWKHRSLNRLRPVILYGRDGVHCHHAAQLLAGRGFSAIYRLMSA